MISYVSTLLLRSLSCIIYTILASSSFFHYLAAPNPGLYRCGKFLMSLERLTCTFLPKDSTFGDVIYWSSVPSGSTFSIETGIYWLSLEPSFCALPMGTCFPLVLGSLTDGLSVLLGTLSITTRSSSEYWGPLTYGDFDPLTLPTIFSLDLLKRVNCSSEVNH